MIDKPFLTPNVGVLVTKKHIKYLRKGIATNRLKLLQEANSKAKVNLFFFSIYDVNLTTLTINGIYYDTNSKAWKSKSFPFPNVLYNRGGVPKSQKNKYKAFQAELNNQGIKHLNYIKGFNKWEVYEKLKQVDTIRPYLPFTTRYDNDKSLINLFKKNNKLYLKACRGRKGYQVMKVVKTNNDIFEYRYFTKDNRVRLREASSRNLLKAIHRFFNHKNFIIQKAIDLPTLDSKIIDMRAEVQRNGTGELEFISICVRLSQAHSPITTHADSYRLEDFFKRYMNYSCDNILILRNKIESFLAEIYFAIEHFYGPIGEMGIDFAIDKNNKVWFIECNSQPAKVSLIKAYDKVTIERAFLNPLEYAKYLINTTE